MLLILALFVLCACAPDEIIIIDSESVQALEREKADLQRTISQLETAVSQLEAASAKPQEVDPGEPEQIIITEIECSDDCVELVLPALWADISGVDRFTLAHVTHPDSFDIRDHIRVFENGNTNIRLFPDGTFVANLFHNSKKTGIYSELTQNNETAVLFTYGGTLSLEGVVSSFDSAGLLTVVGGIVEDVLTLPEDWDDGHGHGLDFAFRAYPLVFIGENDQRITLFADNTFSASFDSGVTVIGYYGMRATSITFVPGSPTFSSDGTPVGSFLYAQLRSCVDDGEDHDHGHDYGDDHDHDHDHGHSHGHSHSH